jgi:hypothetical protein
MYNEEHFTVLEQRIREVIAERGISNIKQNK